MSAMLVNCLFGYKEIEGLWKNNQKEILFLLMGCIDVFSFSFFFFFLVAHESGCFALERCFIMEISCSLKYLKKALIMKCESHIHESRFLTLMLWYTYL